jgi:hypothetical protein
MEVLAEDPEGVQHLYEALRGAGTPARQVLLDAVDVLEQDEAKGQDWGEDAGDDMSFGGELGGAG